MGPALALVRGVRDPFIDAVLAGVPGAVFTGHPTERLPSVASFCFPGTSGESVLLELEFLDGRLYVNVPALARHIKRRLDTPITEHEVRMRLTRLLGFEPAAGTGRLQARNGDRTVTLRALASPPGFDPEA